MNAIEIRNLTVAYGENIALENFNLDILVCIFFARGGPKWGCK